MAASESQVTLRSVVGRSLFYEELDTNFEQLKFVIVDANTHIGSIIAHDAVDLVFDPANSDLASTNVQDAIDEHVESVTAHASEDITYTNPALSASNIKSALDEIVVLNNPSDTTDPTVTDDANAGYKVFSKWVNTVTTEIWICLDNTVGAAVWEKSTLTIDDLGSAALVNMGTGASQLRTNSQNEVLFTDEIETTTIAVDNAITFAIALG
jgi:hypothetical protein